MPNNEEEFAKLPGALICNRYMPGTSLEKRIEALGNLRKLLQTLLDFEEQSIRDELW